MYTLPSESSALTRIKMKVLITFPMLMDTARAPDCRTIQHYNTHGDRFTRGRQGPHSQRRCEDRGYCVASNGVSVALTSTLWTAMHVLKARAYRSPVGLHATSWAAGRGHVCACENAEQIALAQRQIVIWICLKYVIQFGKLLLIQAGPHTRYQVPGPAQTNTA